MLISRLAKSTNHFDDFYEEEDSADTAAGDQPLLPSDPEHCATVYYNIGRFPQEQYREIIAIYEERFPGRDFSYRGIYPEQLRFFQISPFPAAEDAFHQNGFVSNLEHRSFQSSRPKFLTYQQHNFFALDAAGLLMQEILQACGPNFLGWHEDAAAQAKTTTAMLLGGFTGHRLQNGERYRYTLVEHNGLLLPTGHVAAEHFAHMTRNCEIEASRGRAISSEGRQAIFQRDLRSILDQIHFELADPNALFNLEQHWPHVRARLIEDERLDPQDQLAVTSGMIATWFSQVVAALRKISWAVEHETPVSVTNHALLAEFAEYDAPIGTKAKPRRGRPRDRYMQDIVDEFAASCPGIAHDAQVNVCWHYDDAQRMTATLHGATRDDAEDDRVDALFLITHWIGCLKRMGSAPLDPLTASYLLDLFREELGSEEHDLLISLLPEAVWSELLDIAGELQDGEGSVNIFYRWTQDRQLPWAVMRTPQGLEITGPLLSFPVCQALDWRRKAAVVAELGGFCVGQP